MVCAYTVILYNKKNEWQLHEQHRWISQEYPWAKEASHKEWNTVSHPYKVP